MLKKAILLCAGVFLMGEASALSAAQLEALRNGSPNAITHLGTVVDDSGTLDTFSGPGGDVGDTTVQDQIDALIAEFGASSQLSAGAVTANSDLSDVINQLIAESTDLTAALGMGETVENANNRIATVLTGSTQFADGGLTGASSTATLLTQLEGQSTALNTILAGQDLTTRIAAIEALFGIGNLPAIVGGNATMQALFNDIQASQ